MFLESWAEFPGEGKVNIDEYLPGVDYGTYTHHRYIWIPML